MAIVFDKDALSFVDLPNGGYIGKGVSAATLTAWAKVPTVEGGGAISWLTQDIGTATVGSASESAGEFTIEGSGTDIWQASDGFRYVYTSITGDCTITARVTALENTHAHAKAGVMFRQSLNANSMYAMAVAKPVSPSPFTFDRRATNGGTAAGENGATTTLPGAPGWIRCVRSGDTFSGYYSTNGTSWTQVGASQSVVMGATIYVGMAVTSHADGTLCTGVFDSVEVSAVPSGTERYLIQISSNASPTASRMSLSLGASGLWRATGRRLDSDGATVAEDIDLVVPERVYFLAARFDYSGGGLTLFVDGEQVAHTPNAAWEGPSSDTFPWAASIGSNGDASAGFFDGTVDDISVYHEALSNDAVRGLYIARGRQRHMGFVRWTLREGGSGTQAKAKIWDKWAADSHGATGTYYDRWPIYAPENLVSCRPRGG